MRPCIWPRLKSPSQAFLIFTVYIYLPDTKFFQRTASEGIVIGILNNRCGFFLSFLLIQYIVVFYIDIQYTLSYGVIMKQRYWYSLTSAFLLLQDLNAKKVAELNIF